MSLFIPDPVNIYITKNMFVRYHSTGGINKDVGLIVNISQEHNVVTVRRFMSWMQLLTFVGDAMIPNISFWPLNSQTNPLYLCDSDILVNIHINQVKGLAFVFHVDDSVVTRIHGMAHTYIVSSCFSSAELTVTHIRSFISFPSLCVENRLLSCFPSIIFRQLLGVKQRMQHLLNTRSMSEKCTLSCSVSDIDPLTWYYITSNLPTVYHYRNVVQKKTCLSRDAFVVEKYRAMQVTVDLSLPVHLSMAQKVFGFSVGLGTRNVLRCSLKRRGASARETVHHQMNFADTMNIIPFDDAAYESVRQGLELKYTPSKMELLIIVRYRILTGRGSIEPHLISRNIPDTILMLQKAMTTILFFRYCYFWY